MSIRNTTSFFEIETSHTATNESFTKESSITYENILKVKFENNLPVKPGLEVKDINSKLPLMVFNNCQGLCKFYINNK